MSEQQLTKSFGYYICGKDDLLADHDVSSRTEFLDTVAARWGKSHGLDVSAKDVYDGLLDRRPGGHVDVSRLIWLVNYPVGIAPYFAARTANLDLKRGSRLAPAVVDLAAALLREYEHELSIPVASQLALSSAVPSLWKRLLHRSLIAGAAARGCLRWREFQRLFDVPELLIPVPPCARIEHAVHQQELAKDDALLFWRLASGYPEATWEDIDEAKRSDVQWRAAPARLLFRGLRRDVKRSGK